VTYRAVFSAFVLEIESFGTRGTLFGDTGVGSIPNGQKQLCKKTLIECDHVYVCNTVIVA